MNVSERFQAMIDAWNDGVITLPRLVLAVDQIVSDLGPENRDTSRSARAVWGQIEIINALTLDAGSVLTDEDRTDIDALLVELNHFLSDLK